MTAPATRLPAPLNLRGVTFSPPLFCAPMVGITHSAFRRLLGDFGGAGALWTEMLAARRIVHENPLASPWLKRRPGDGRLFYQLLATRAEGLAEAVAHLAAVQPDGIDLNAACPAPGVRRDGGGVQLFEDAPRLRDIVRVLRRAFAGPLTVKLRLGHRAAGWRERLRDRLRLLEDEGVDALTIHPRHAEDELRRTARHALYAELAADTRLPIVANGDIAGPGYAAAHADALAPAAGLMLGRLVAAQPWLLAQWHNPGLVVDRAAVWERLCDYIVEDFPPHQALGRIRILAPYYGRNFLFGHTFFARVQSAPDLATARARATAFLAASPDLAPRVTVEGL